MTGYDSHSEPDFLSWILARLAAVDDLLALLRAHTRPGPILRVTLAPWAWEMLWMHDIEIIAAAFGDAAPDERGRVRSLNGWYIYTHDGMVQVDVDPEQSTAYRLWDRLDRELVGDRRGWYYVVSGEPGG